MTMDILEEIEGLHDQEKETRQLEGITEAEWDYVGECIAPPRPEELVMRIDEIQGGQASQSHRPRPTACCTDRTRQGSYPLKIP